jgi:zinc-ribbon domain
MGMPPDAPDERPAEPPAPDAEGGKCPRCGTPYEPGQEYCLECGLRLPVARGIVPVLSAAWRRHIPWYPGDWIWPVMLFFVIAALGAAAAILATRDDDSSATRTLVGTTEPAGGTGTTPAEPPPPETGTTGQPPPQTDTEPVEPPPPPPPSGPIAWPAGQSGWTVVLLSLPESSGQAAAQSSARKAIADGLTDVGVLNSSDYASLHPGYFVVFTGVYNTLDEARAGLETARATYPQAYTREITQ